MGSSLSYLVHWQRIYVFLTLRLLSRVLQLRQLLGRMDDLPFFDYLSPFIFLLIEFCCIFSISYKILPILFIIIGF